MASLKAPNSNFIAQSKDTTPRAKLRFQGFMTTEAASKTHLKPDALKELLINDTDPYVGSAPVALCERLGMDHFELRHKLDQLADQLDTGINRLMPRQQKFPPVPFLNTVIQRIFPSLENNAPKISWVGEGGFGRVYRLGQDESSVAFKVFKDRKNPINSEPFREAANGLYLTQLETSDVAKFYCGNPSEGWILYEFISPSGGVTSFEKRTGKTLAQNGFVLDDDKPLNRVAGIRVDLGGELNDLEQRWKEAKLLGIEAVEG